MSFDTSALRTVIADQPNKIFCSLLAIIISRFLLVYLLINMFMSHLTDWTSLHNRSTDVMSVSVMHSPVFVYELKSMRPYPVQPHVILTPGQQCFSLRVCRVKKSI